MDIGLVVRELDIDFPAGSGIAINNLAHLLEKHLCHNVTLIHSGEFNTWANWDVEDLRQTRKLDFGSHEFYIFTKPAHSVEFFKRGLTSPHTTSLHALPNPIVPGFEQQINFQLFGAMRSAVIQHENYRMYIPSHVKTHIIPNSHNIFEMAEHKDDDIEKIYDFLWIGSITSAKGFEEVLELSTRYKIAVATYSAGVDIEAFLHDHDEIPRKSSNISMFFMQDREDMYKLFNASSRLLVTSGFELFPTMSMLEACAFDVPIYMNVSYMSEEVPLECLPVNCYRNHRELYFQLSDEPVPPALHQFDNRYIARLWNKVIQDELRAYV